MHVLIIGDVGWDDFYHLGDEAMTEFAIEAVRAQGADDITLVAGNPQYAGRMYEVDGVNRFGFRMGHRASNAARSAAILAHVRGEASLHDSDRALPTLRALETADALLIAGGGNLNSTFDHHIYDRLTLARVAREYGVPYALTSQTLGPLIYRDDRSLIEELLCGARFFTAREDHTYRVASEIAGAKTEVLLQVDDAFSLTANPSDREAIADLTGAPFVIASFAEKSSSPVLSTADYHALAARIIREIAERAGIRVLLVPHAGALQADKFKRDEISNETIARIADHSNVRTVRMLTARQLAALTEEASLVIGTRYHAGIFAAAVGVPHVALAPNMYSSVRMRGAARNIGFEDFVLPISHASAVIDTATGMLGTDARASAVCDHLRSAADTLTRSHAKYWDAAMDTLLRNGNGVGTAHHHESVKSISNTFVGAIEQLRENLDLTEVCGILHQEDRFESDQQRRALKAEVDEITSRLDAMKKENADLRKTITVLSRETKFMGKTRRRLWQARQKWRKRSSSWN